MKQNYATKSYFHLAKTASEILVLIKGAYKGDILSKDRVVRWCVEFKYSQETVEDMERSARLHRLFYKRGVACKEFVPPEEP